MLNVFSAHWTRTMPTVPQIFGTVLAHALVHTAAAEIASLSEMLPTGVQAFDASGMCQQVASDSLQSDAEVSGKALRFESLSPKGIISLG